MRMVARTDQDVVLCTPEVCKATENCETAKNLYVEFSGREHFGERAMKDRVFRGKS